MPVVRPEAGDVLNPAGFEAAIRDVEKRAQDMTMTVWAIRRAGLHDRTPLAGAIFQDMQLAARLLRNAAKSMRQAHGLMQPEEAA